MNSTRNITRLGAFRLLLALLLGVLMLTAVVQDRFRPRACVMLRPVESDTTEIPHEESPSSPSPYRRCDSRHCSPLIASASPVSRKIPLLAAPRPVAVNPCSSVPSSPVPLRC